MAEDKEQKIIDACLKGDRAAQKQLFDRFAPVMYSVCLRYVGDREVAQDLLQDGFVTLFTKLDSYKGDGSFEGWVRRIFINTALMYLRKKDALRMTEDLDNVRNLSSDIPTQIENIGYGELMKLIAQLPPGFRTVFNMYVVEGYSHKDIAEELGITETTSRTQLSRARNWLQARIKDR
ncbi:MAG: sigma-70 family RNA polymerase sigma factor [Bacteroidales bacterium]|nr:sigma-70 family RNA polymerase sigma factor [Bacteroidales bacterium]